MTEANSTNPITTSWRYIDCGAVDAFENNAQMPVMLRSVSEQNRPTLMTSVWGATHLNVGWFDDVDSTLDLDACKRLGVQVVRRPMYGGGTAFYAKDCAALWSFLIPKVQGDDGASLDAGIAKFQPIVLDALSRIGLGEVVFEGSSDLRWNGRKLGAMPAQDVMIALSVGGFINLAPPDLDLYLQVVRIPDDKFKDKVVKDMREYVVTAEQIAGHPVSYEMFRDALLGATRDAGIELSEEPFSEGELKGLNKGAARVASDEFIRRISSERFSAEAPVGCTVGFGNHKGRKLCRAGVAVDAGGTVVAAMMAGDMHVGPPDIIDRVASALVGAKASDAGDLRARIAEVFESTEVHQADDALGVTTDDLLAAVEKAVAASN